MARRFLCVYLDMLPALEALEPPEVGRLMIAALRYAASGEPPASLKGKEAVLWPVLMAQIDRNNESYIRRCKINRENRLSATIRHESSRVVTNRHNRIEENKTEQKREEESIPPDPPQGGSPSPPSKRFVPPTLDEIRAYCLERKNAVDPERFFSYYTSNGWRVGKNPMKDWQAAVRTWERSEPTFSRPAGSGSRNVQTASCLSEEDQIRKYGPLPSVDQLQDLVDRI